MYAYLAGGIPSIKGGEFFRVEIEDARQFSMNLLSPLF
jgi:hypothetical protein